MKTLNFMSHSGVRILLFMASISVPGLATGASWQEQDAQTQSGEEALDFVIQDVCVDANNQPIAADPTTCWPRRNLRIGEPIPYLRTDFAPGGQRPQALASVPVPGRDGTLKILISKNFGGGSRDANYQFFNSNNIWLGDGYDLMETNGRYFGFQRTFDGGCFDQVFNEDGWVSFDRGNFNSSAHLPIVLTRLYPRPGCDAVSQGYAYTVFNRLNVGYTAGHVMDTIESYHYADQDLSRPLENALEKYYFTKQLGFTRWEAWVPLARCYRDSPSQCGPAVTNQRCNGDTYANIGGNTWVRTDCRDSTNISMVKTPFFPLNSDMAASDVDMHSAFQSEGISRLIRQLAIDVLGRDPASLTSDQARAYWGAILGTPYDIRLNFASSDEAGIRIRQLAIDVLGRDSSLTLEQARANWGFILKNGGTLADIRYIFAQSEESAIRIRQLAIDVLGRDSSLTTEQARLYWGAIIANGGSLNDVRRIFSASDESAIRIRQLAIDMLGRDSTLTLAQVRASWGHLLNARTLSDVKRVFAESEEAATRIRQLAIDVLGRDSSLTVAQAKMHWTSILINGGTLADVRRIFAASEESGLQVRNAVRDILGRDPTGVELANYKGQLSSGVRTIATIRTELRESIAIRGIIDGVALSPDRARAFVRGWACARQIPRSINVQVLVGRSPADGVRVVSAVANVAHEPGVSTVCSDASNTPHRFEIALSDAVRSQFSGQLIYVYGLNPASSQGRVLLANSGQFRVPAPRIISLQAEKALQLPLDMIKQEEGRGTRYVELNTAGVRQLKFPILLEKAGKYRIVARTTARDALSNTFYLRSALQTIVVKVPQKATWVRAYGVDHQSEKGALAEIALPAGSSMLRIGARGNGLLLDAFRLEPIE